MSVDTFVMSIRCSFRRAARPLGLRTIALTVKGKMYGLRPSLTVSLGERAPGAHTAALVRGGDGRKWR
jgi:hypothetical protein